MTHEVELVSDVERDRLRLPLDSANVKTYLRLCSGQARL